MHQAAGASDVQMATQMEKYRVANFGDLIRRVPRSPRIRNSRFEGTVGLRPVAGPFRVTPDAMWKLPCERGARKWIKVTLELGGAKAASVGGCNDLRVARSARAQARCLRNDADTSEVEAIGVPARQHRRIAGPRAGAVPRARREEQFELAVGEVEKRTATGQGELGGALAVIWIVIVVMALDVVKYGEELDDAGYGSGRRRQVESVVADASPMRRAVDSVPVERELAPECGEKRLGKNRLRHCGVLCEQVSDGCRFPRHFLTRSLVPSRQANSSLY